jgi:hypothetical protein
MLFFWIIGTMNSLSAIKSTASNPEVSQAVTSAGDALKNAQLPNLQDLASQDTADWNSYTNTDYGFSIKYPKDWKIIEDLPNKKFSIKFASDSSYPVLTIQYLTDDYAKVLQKQQQALPDNINDLMIYDTSAKEFLYNSPTGAVAQVIVFQKNGFTVKMNSFQSSVLDPILTTFEFTK